MKRALLEKGTVVVLFILVLVVFSFAERDSKKLVELYTKKTVDRPVIKEGIYTAETATAKEAPSKTTRN